MVNDILFKSSIIFILPQAVVKFYIFQSLYHFHVILSFCSALFSVLNYGYSNDNDWTIVFKYIDRFFVYVESGVNIIIFPSANIPLIFICFCLYYLSKNANSSNGNFLHIILHFVGILINMSVTWKLLKES